MLEEVSGLYWDRSGSTEKRLVRLGGAHLINLEMMQE